MVKQYRLKKSFRAGYFQPGDPASETNSLVVEDDDLDYDISLFSPVELTEDGSLYQGQDPRLPANHPIRIYEMMQGAINSGPYLEAIAQAVHFSWRLEGDRLLPPRWSEYIVDLPIYPGLKRVTWGHATKGCQREPTPEQMLRISAIAHVADEMLKLPGLGITLWIPDPCRSQGDVERFPRLVTGDSFCYCADWRSAQGRLPCCLEHYQGGHVRRIRDVYNVDARYIQIGGV